MNIISSMNMSRVWAQCLSEFARRLDMEEKIMAIMQQYQEKA